MSQLTYVMIKPRKVGRVVRQPGELVPEAAEWKNRDAYLNRGVISPVPIDSLSSEHRQTYDTWLAERGTVRSAPGGGDHTPPPSEGSPDLSEQVASLTIGEIKDRVQSGQWSPESVWEAEAGGKQRSTLTDWLEEQME